MKTAIKGNLMYGCKDVMKECKVGKTKAYQLMQQINFNLIREGYKTVQGRVPSRIIKENYR